MAALPQNKTTAPETIRLFFFFSMFILFLSQSPTNQRPVVRGHRIELWGGCGFAFFFFFDIGKTSLISFPDFGAQYWKTKFSESQCETDRNLCTVFFFFFCTAPKKQEREKTCAGRDVSPHVKQPRRAFLLCHEEDPMAACVCQSARQKEEHGSWTRMP